MKVAMLVEYDYDTQVERVSTFVDGVCIITTDTPKPPQDAMAAAVSDLVAATRAAVARGDGVSSN